uniref:Uncharacterized protein n=1 Tax=Arundo donax TaxID=35708 RepID=A0A0A9FSI9_ARUDO
MQVRNTCSVLMRSSSLFVCNFSAEHAVPTGLFFYLIAVVPTIGYNRPNLWCKRVYN